MNAPIRSDFRDLATALCRKPDEVIFVVVGYYDESGEYDTSGRLTGMAIGGCISSSQKWEGFENEWLGLLRVEGLEFFHMTDFEAWQPPFDFKIGDTDQWDHERHKRLLNGLLGVMLDHAQCFYGFTTHSIPKDPGRAHGDAIEECTSAAVTHAVHNLWLMYGRPASLVFAAQGHFSATGMMKCVERYKWGEGRERINSATTASPKAIPMLQAADIVAYEMKRLKRSNAQRRPLRYPLRFLIEGAMERDLAIALDPRQPFGPDGALSQARQLS